MTTTVDPDRRSGGERRSGPTARNVLTGPRPHVTLQQRASHSTMTALVTPHAPSQARPMADTTTPDAGASAPFALPRVTIKFCTQCKWNLRAAYYAQELLSTFSTTLGEVALQPATGGTFVVEIFHPASPDIPAPTPPTPAPAPSSDSDSACRPPPPPPPIPSHPDIASTVLWDRAADGGFPEPKELKRRVRDVVAPGHSLGHVDRDHPPRPRPRGPGPSDAAPPPAPAPAPAPAPTTETAPADGEQQQQQPSRTERGAAGGAAASEAAGPLVVGGWQRPGGLKAAPRCEDCA